MPMPGALDEAAARQPDDLTPPWRAPERVRDARGKSARLGGRGGNGKGLTLNGIRSPSRVPDVHRLLA